MIGMAAANGRNDIRLGLAVDVRDKVVAALGVDLERVETRKVPHDGMPARRAARMPMLRSGCMAIGARITEHGLPGSHRAHRPESSRQCRLGGARHEEHGAGRPHAGASAVVPAPGIERPRGRRRRHPGEGARGGQRRRGDRGLRLRRRHDLASALLLLGIHTRARWPRTSSGSARRIARRSCSARSATVSAPRTSTIATCWCGSLRIPRIARSTSPCRCSCSRTSSSWRASNRNRTCSSSSPSRRRATSSISTRTCTRCSMKSISRTAPGI